MTSERSGTKQLQSDGTDRPWLALSIGNSRLHWGYFCGDSLRTSWREPHRSSASTAIAALVAGDRAFPKIFPSPQPPTPPLHLPPAPPLYIASVVPDQTRLWQAYPRARAIAPAEIPLPGAYATLGLDRRLAVWEAGCDRGFPVLVVDGGTALTVTTAGPDGGFAGGAILPGLKVQLEALTQRFPALPSVSLLNCDSLPSFFAGSTPEALQSGVLYGACAAVRAIAQRWRQQYPTSALVLTGGDAALLSSALRQEFPAIASAFFPVPDLLLWGIARWVRNNAIGTE